MKRHHVSIYLKWIGFFVMIGGVVLPFLIVIKIIEANFFLLFLAYFLSLAGLILEILGIIGYGDDIVPPREN